MFSRANRPNGRVTAARVVAVTSAGDVVTLGGRALGLRRAELEGELDRSPTPEAHRRLLVLLDEAYRRRGPHRPRLRELRLVEDVTFVRDGRPRGATTTVFATYRP
jgi:hypothetical protein